MDKIKVINVALPIKINSYYTYSIPDNLGMNDILFKRVLVDFNGRLIRGFTVSQAQYTDKFKIKQINKILDKRTVFTKEMVGFAQWIADYYFCGIGEVLSLMIPKALKPAKEEEVKEFLPKKNQLTKAQDDIYLNIKNDMDKGLKKFYIYGITGSGKTEIYIKLIEDTIISGKNVIFLVPEIALSYQTLERLKERFGQTCTVLHSNLSGSIRFREYLKLLDGRAKIVIGPRSALFAPLKNIGLIIIDEENESSYKSEESPRFHSRTVAQYLANIHNCAIVLGSATPSIESWYYAKVGYFKLYTLMERFGGAELPEIKIIDTSKTVINRNLSLPLIEEINKRLQNKEQIVLLQNRRGFANFIKCDNCTNIINCPKCTISLTYHRSRDKLICHHCGFAIQFPKVCPKCSSSKLLKIGAGTERIEDDVIHTFLNAKVQRMDHDSLKKKVDINEIFNKVKNGEIDILIGTQMIAKGLHFPKIKFVGIINADMILNIPDFKAAERTFSLITQVAGRAGRVGERGIVMIQTLNPEHYAIQCAKGHDYETFYTQEINFRKILFMPPFTRLLRLVIRGKNELSVEKDSVKLADILKGKGDRAVKILGPAPCLFSKINNNFRYQILLKSKNIKNLQGIAGKALNNFKIYHRNYLEIDVDPIALL